MRLPHGEGLPLPARATSGSAGMDVVAAADAVIEPMGRALIPTGFAVAVPEGYELQARPRSGLALKHGIILPNSPGTIDADYRGEIRVIMSNIGRAPYVIQRGERIAQMVVAPVTHVQWRETDSLNETDRGVGGFGHSGTH